MGGGKGVRGGGCRRGEGKGREGERGLYDIRQMVVGGGKGRGR